VNLAIGEICGEVIRLILEALLEAVRVIVTATGRVILSGRKPTALTAFGVGLLVWAGVIGSITAVALMLPGR
jgi:hypothetical protein